MDIEYNGMMPVVDIEAIEQAVEAYIDEHMGGTGYYVVHTEDSRVEAVREYIEESLWAFNASFISYHTNVSEEAIEKVQELYEGANEVLIELIEDMDNLVDDAVMSDGYGHFLSSYDGEEHEVEVNGDTYFIYAN